MKRIIIILCSILLLQSCGLKFWYNRLDWVVSWQVDDFVELSSAQEDQLEALVRQKLQWHRTTQLPRYVSLIQQLESEIGTEKIDANYDYYRDNLIDFYQTALQQIVPELVSQVVNLNNEQTQELMKNLNDNANESLQEYTETEADERLEDRLENTIDGVQEWTGRLNKKQKAIIKQWINELEPTAELRFNYSAQWRVAMDYALAERATPKGQDNLLKLMMNPSDMQSEELRSRYAFNRTLQKRYILELHKTMTKKQKKKMLRKLKSYREDFEDLIEDD